MNVNTVIEIADSDLDLLEQHFKTNKKDWEIAELFDKPIMQDINEVPNNISAHINKLVQLGISVLKENNL